MEVGLEGKKEPGAGGLWDTTAGGREAEVRTKETAGGEWMRGEKHQQQLNLRNKKKKIICTLKNKSLAKLISCSVDTTCCPTGECKM